MFFLLTSMLFWLIPNYGAVSPGHIPHDHSTIVCTAQSWHGAMTTNERWIARRESGMDPTPADINPQSGARELGQLLPETLDNLGLTPSWDPCVQIKHMRIYMHEHYGSEDNAVSWWKDHYWY